MRIHVLCAAVLAGAAAEAAGQGVRPDLPPVDVLADDVAPGVIEPGEVTVRRVTVVTAPGVMLSYPEVLPSQGGTEASRSVRLHRSGGAGEVRWVFSYPFTAWVEGDAVTGPLTLMARGRGGERTLSLGGQSVSVVSPLPRARIHRPAPPEEPWPVSLPMEALLPLLPLTLALASGGIWLRAGRGDASAPPASAASEEVPLVPPPSLRETLSDESLAEPVLTLALAAAARRHPAVVEAGVGPWHTTPEVRLTLRRSGAATAADVLTPLLQAADAVAYGGRQAPELDARALGFRVLEVLGDG